MIAWITNELPDSDLTVLMRLDDSAYPVWPGFHDGEHWCNADASLVEQKVIGWMNLNDAAEACDRALALWGVLSAVRVTTKFRQTEKIAELLPRIDEVLETESERAR